MNVLAFIGGSVLQRLRDVGYLAAVVSGVLLVAARPDTWRRTVRDALGRQVFSVGVKSIGLVCLVALAVGIPVVVQTQLWLGHVGQSELLGPILVTVVLREAGPLLANLMVIGRSANVIAAELGAMKLSGEVRALDAQGLDPFVYLVVPRVLGVTISVLCLSVLFILLALISGYVCGRLVGVQTPPAVFLDSITGAIGLADLLNVVLKAVVPALLSGTICCAEGLDTGDGVADVGQAMSRSLHRSVVALFVTSALISVLTYV